MKLKILKSLVRRTPKLVKRLLEFFVAMPIGFLRIFIRKDPCLVFFLLGGRKGFSDNPKYFYLYLIQRRKKEKIPIRFFWIAFSEKVHRNLKRLGYPVIRFKDLFGKRMNLLLRGSWIISSGGKNFIFSFVLGYRVIFLWHGVGMKKIAFLTVRKHEEKGLSRIKKLLSWVFLDPQRFIPANVILVTSDFFYKVFKAALVTNKQTVFIIDNYPRNEALISSIAGEDIFAAKIPADVGEKIVVYAPTVRGRNWISEVFTFDNLHRLEKVLEKHNAVFIMKLHPWDYRLTISIRRYIKHRNTKRIILVDPSLDIYPLLRRTDVLISDYSSIWTDFLWVDKPIIHFAFDYKQWKQRDAFIFPLEIGYAGPVVSSFDELLKTLDEVLSGLDHYKIRRCALRRIFFKKPPMHASERIYQILLNKVFRKCR